ncbi:MAG: alkaline phosphatase family protein, partial [Phycisphaerae bacterium]
MRRGCVIALFGLMCCLPIPRTAAAANTGPGRRVLLVSFDGLRPDAIPLAETPVMRQLIATGSYQATALDEVPSVTLPNHVSMVTGLRIVSHGVWLNTGLPGRVSAQTVFDVAKSAGLGVGFFANKQKLAFLCEEGAVDAWRIVGDVDSLADEVIAALATDDLPLIFVHFGEPDGSGHTAGWMSEPYLTQVARADAALGRILDALETQGLRDQTVVIVTSDHGGHAHTHHGVGVLEDQLIPFIVNGPGIAPGRTLCEPIRIMDTAPTILAILGLPTTMASDGRVVTEAFDSFVQGDCTVVPPSLPCGPLPILLLTPVALVVLVSRRGHRECILRMRADER